MKKSIHSDPQKLLCEWLRAARKKAQLTQQQLADRLGKPQSFVAKYEAGERRLDVVEFVTIAVCLGADPAVLVNKLRQGS